MNENRQWLENDPIFSLRWRFLIVMNQLPKTQDDNELSRVVRFVGYLVAVLWVLNAMLLVAAVIWVFSDGRSLRKIEYVQYELGLIDSPIMFRESSRAGAAPWEVKTAALAALIAGGTLAAMFVSLFLGGRRYRTLRGWMVFTTLVAGWLGAVVAWPEIYWMGQMRRVASALPAVGTVAENLAANWPAGDDELPDIGSFLAYPKGEPRALLPLGTVSFPGTTLRFSAVERSADGTIRFELAGRESGAWVERRLDGGDPEPFVGGLETQNRITRKQRLATGWFLVRYRSAATMPGR